jgi:hypothetical protein
MVLELIGVKKKSHSGGALPKAVPKRIGWPTKEQASYPDMGYHGIHGNALAG